VPQRSAGRAHMAQTVRRNAMRCGSVVFSMSSNDVFSIAVGEDPCTFSEQAESTQAEQAVNQNLLVPEEDSCVPRTPLGRPAGATGLVASCLFLSGFNVVFP
jgi:hypothetical protein